jgi:hypothetical protein
MAELFALDAHRCGAPRRVHAEDDGFGIAVYTSAGIRRAASIQEAIRFARDDIGSFLQPAERGGVPWGLRVTVSGGQAVYGEWPLLPGPPSGSRFEETLLSRIRRRWRGGGPLSALENAIEITRAYTSGSAARRAA